MTVPKIPAIPISINVPQVPCVDIANKQAWLDFFSKLKALLGDANFFRVLTHCAAEHGSCITLQPDLPISLSPSQPQRPVAVPNPGRVFTPCVERGPDGQMLNPLLSEKCVNCIFRDSCQSYRKPVAMVAKILGAIVCPTSKNDQEDVIDQDYVRNLCKNILDEVCPNAYNPELLNELDVDQPFIDQVNSTVRLWRTKMPFLCRKAVKTSVSFWDEWGIYILMVGVGLLFMWAIYKFVPQVKPKLKVESPIPDLPTLVESPIPDLPTLDDQKVIDDIFKTK